MKNNTFSKYAGAKQSRKTNPRASDRLSSIVHMLALRSFPEVEKFQEIKNRGNSPKIRIEIPKIAPIITKITTDTITANIPTAIAPNQPVS